MKHLRKDCQQWLGAMYVANAVIFAIAAISYLFYLPYPYHTTYSILFLALAFVGQFGVIALLATVIPAIFIILIYPKKILVTASVIITSCCMLTLIIIDIGTFSLFHFHPNLLMLEMILSPEAITFFGLNNTEIMMIAAALLFMLLLYCGVAYLLWRFKNQKLWWCGQILWVVAILSLLTSQMMHAWADIKQITPVIQNARAIPFYFNVTSRRFFLKHHFVTPQQLIKNAQNQFNELKHANTVHYPLAPLKAQVKGKLPNIIVIGIDAWRADSFTQKNTPNIYHFAKNAWVFNNEYSAGNCTQAGLFSLFYSIPNTYWQAMHKPPAFFELLKKYKYKQRIFFASGIIDPPFYKNIFKSVANLELSTPYSASWQKDEYETAKMIKFINKNQNNNKPFFAFLFYDSAHNFSFPPNFKTKFNPWWHNFNHFALNNHFNPTPYFNLYRNALYFDDGLVGRVLKQLQDAKLLKNTIVIITSDHGQEFNDNHRNYWLHSSNFTQYQTKVPLIIYWPGQKHKLFDYKTSNYDLMPLLLQNVFHVSNPVEDYSVGQNILKATSWQDLIVGSYSYNGIITPNYSIRLYPGGFYRVFDAHAKPLWNVKIDPHLILWSTKLMSRYYQ